jgi:hypothetical protein
MVLLLGCGCGVYRTWFGGEVIWVSIVSGTWGGDGGAGGGRGAEGGETAVARIIVFFVC